MLTTTRNHSNFITEFKITAICVTDNYTFIGNNNGQLHLLDACTAQITRQMNGHTNRIPILCIVYCVELNTVITGSEDSTARVWNVATGKCLHVLKGHSGGVGCAAVHGTMQVAST